MPLARWCVPAALISLVVAACNQGSSASNYCNCGTGNDGVSFQLACIPASPPVVTITGPCVIGPSGPGTIAVSGNVVGTCHVDMTFVNGGTFSTDLSITSEWLACGSDPHGCGQVSVITPFEVSIPNHCGDAGADAESSG
jgi:hypothetical protein